MKKFTVYKTTNQLNGMFYIGVHKTDNPNDTYMGSGKRLGYAISKYGVDNFKKEILAIFETKEEAYALEAKFVTADVLDAGKCYNLKLGGQGGFDHILATITKAELCARLEKGRNITNEKWKNDPTWAAAQRARKIVAGSIVAEHAKVTFAKMRSEGLLKGSFLGQHHTSETKAKMSASKKITSAGERNSQFGKCWIMNTSESKPIKLEELPQYLENGWTKGRKVKF